MSKLRVSLSAVGAKNVSWPWLLSPLRGWGSLTMSLTGKFVYMAHHFILLQLNPFDLSLELTGRDGGFPALCHKCGFPSQH